MSYSQNSNLIKMNNFGGRDKSQASAKSTMHVRTIEVVLDDGHSDEEHT